jgi:hypothetical protein
MPAGRATRLSMAHFILAAWKTLALWAELIRHSMATNKLHRQLIHCNEQSGSVLVGKSYTTRIKHLQKTYHLFF